MKTLDRYELWHGTAEPPPETYELRAGPLTALLEGPDLRHIRLGAIELAQRIYMAVRDEGWNTIPGTYSDFETDIGEDQFQIRFTGRHRYGDLDYEWRATIVGTPEGTISYAMDGTAHCEFRYNKIGFNVHHPLAETVGRPYTAHTSDGEISGSLPEIIDPQLIVDGTLTAMFAPYDSLTISLEGDVDVRFDFEGDLFELQDHRNWTDANYKSYGTPLAIPYPMDAHAEQELHQKVTVSVAKAPERIPQLPRELAVELGSSTGHGLPSIGLGLSTQDGVPTEREARLLRDLHIDHVRVDLHLNDPHYRDELRRGVETAQAVGAGLELALFLSSRMEDELAQLRPSLESLDVPVKRVLVFEEAEGFSTFRTMTSGSVVRLAKERLQSAVPDAVFAGGTDQFFTELNRDWSQVESLDAIAYSFNPQVHAADDASLMENLQGQADTVRSTRHYCGERAIFVSPVTFVGRVGPFPAGPPEEGGLPGQVDVRQASLFGAAWTLGTIAQLAQAGVASVTFFETTGWRGVIERESGSPMPDRFPSKPGEVFPMYHVFADVGEVKDGKVIEARSNDPLTIAALGIRSGETLHLLLANLTPKTQTVEVGPLPSEQVRVRALDEETALAALSNPEGFRRSFQTRATQDGRLTGELLPYAVIHIDADQSQ